jgi:long-chain acyl-CoA synthetase
MKSQPWLEIYNELNIEMPSFTGRTMGSYLEEHAQVKSDAIALTMFNKSMTFSEYNAEANRLANSLSKLNIGKGDVVGLHMPNILQYVIALAAISKMGAIGTGISPIMAPVEVVNQIKDANVKALLSFEDLGATLQGVAELPSCLEQVIVCGVQDYNSSTVVSVPQLSGVEVTAFKELIEGQSIEFESVDTNPEDTFMIQYTGGTTGAPKGAQLSHRALVCNAQITYATSNQSNKYGMTLGSAFPLFHVAGLNNILSCVIFGGRYLLFPDPRDTDHICAVFKAIPPTHIVAVPALYDMLMANPAFNEIDFSRLLVAHTGAAPVTKTTLAALDAVIGENKISDGFGMTETGGGHVIHPNRRYKLGSVGIPVIGSDLRIVDTDTGSRVLDVGEQGEIITSGPHLMTGYLNRPDATAESLREIDGKLWMYTGDVGYLDEEGYLFLCDRAKDMLIVGGYKVFSVELEDKLCSLPQIASCAVIGTPDERRPGNDVVNLFVELAEAYKQSNPDQLAEQITFFCRANMAAFKVPKKIHFIDAIPLTAVGKIDKKSLRKSG